MTFIYLKPSYLPTIVPLFSIDNLSLNLPFWLTKLVPMFLPTSLGTKKNVQDNTKGSGGILIRSASPSVHEHFLAGLHGLVAQIPNHPWLVIDGRIMDAGEYRWKDATVPKQP
jgi:hypothetical protein